MSPPSPPPSPRWGEGKGEGKFQIFLASFRFVEKEEIGVTSQGKPKTIIKEDSDRNVENNLLEYNPEFLSSLEKAKEEYLNLGGLSVDNYLRRRKT